MSPAIAIDVTPTITGRTGVSRYVRELVAAIEAGGGAQLRPFALGRALEPVPAGTRHLPVPLRVLDRAWRLTRWPPADLLAGRCDTLHASGPVLPPCRRPVVAVVHDLAPLDHPALHPRRDVDQLRRYLDGLDRAAAVIAVSGATGDRLVAHGVDRARVHVVANGATPLPRPVEVHAPAGPLVLAVGAPVPRKRFDVLLEAVGALGRHDVSVAVVGPPGSQDGALAALAARLGLGARYVRTGPVTDGELAGWYRAATVVAAPSAEEGFGLPLVEAMLAQVPVVASDLPVFREVTGGHATFAPAGDPGALADALAGALDGAGDAAVAPAAEHAGRYTWAACARATLAVHAAVLG